jgi:hypothetical protein
MQLATASHEDQTSRPTKLSENQREKYQNKAELQGSTHDKQNKA